MRRGARRRVTARGLPSFLRASNGGAGTLRRSSCQRTTHATGSRQQEGSTWMAPGIRAAARWIVRLLQSPSSQHKRLHSVIIEAIPEDRLDSGHSPTGWTAPPDEFGPRPTCTPFQSEPEGRRAGIGHQAVRSSEACEAHARFPVAASYWVLLFRGRFLLQLSRHSSPDRDGEHLLARLRRLTIAATPRSRMPYATSSTAYL